MPTDRHTATGTCEIGRRKTKRSGSESQAICVYPLQNHSRTRSSFTFRQCVAAQWVQCRRQKKRRGIGAAPKFPCDLRERDRPGFPRLPLFFLLHHATSTFLNCHGSLGSTSSGSKAPRPSSGVQSVYGPTTGP